MVNPKFSIIIPVAPWDEPKNSIKSLENVDYPKNKFEIFLIKGTNPSRQRNEGIIKAKGEIIVFLDNDSEIPKDYLKKIEEHHRTYDIVGGPAETSNEDTFLGKCFGAVIGTYFTSQKMQAKFKGIGKLREATEKELILCNLSIKRETLIKYGLFNEKLYPNEENELLNNLERNGIKAVYDPKCPIYRRQRETLYKFSKQFFKYGKSRIEHFKEEPKNISPIFFTPAIFVLYLISLNFFNPLWYLAPLILYILVNLTTTITTTIEYKNLKMALIIPFLFPLVHISYGLGILTGIFTKKEQNKKGEIIIQKIQ